MFPAAPALFSMTKACPVRSRSPWARKRPMVSRPEPAEVPTTRVTGLAGQVCAWAIEATIATANAAVIDRSSRTLFPS